jgi:hypothetical protein
MGFGDRQVWAEFLRRRGAEWSDYAYDVELDRSGPAVAVDDPAMRRMWTRLVAKRVDAVALRSAGATLVEVRTKAAWQSVGQLIGYRALWPRDYPGVPLEGVLLVTDEIDAAIRAVAEGQGLAVWATRD